MRPLISDLLMELLSGERVPLGSTFVLPPGLPGIGSNDEADRAPDSKYVVRSGDELPTVYSVTIPGLITAQSPTELLDRLDVFNRQVSQCRKIWRGKRAYLSTQYGVLPQPQMRVGWLSADVTPIFRLAYLGWRRPDGTEVFG